VPLSQLEGPSPAIHCNQKESGNQFPLSCQYFIANFELLLTYSPHPFWFQDFVPSVYSQALSDSFLLK
jgi:hypothetical protein